MGETIRKDAAAQDIIGDVRTTLDNARAKGARWQTLAEEKLGATLALIGTLETRLNEAKTVATPLLAAIDAGDERADRALGKISDDIWNEVGRPASDPALSVLFPGGIAYYAEGVIGEQPERMELLAELLESNLHPRLRPDKAREYATAVRSHATELRTACDAARGPSLRLTQLERVYNSVARVAHTNLANLKRVYRAEGFSEAEIHRVIPDRPTKKKVTPPVEPTA